MILVAVTWSQSYTQGQALELLGTLAKCQLVVSVFCLAALVVIAVNTWRK